MINVNQEQAFEYLKSGSNIFLTGEGGAGKTYLVKKWASESKKNIALTATTGIAALNLGGETIHKFLGTGITTRPEEASKIIGKWENIKKSGKPWDVAKFKVMKNIDALIIDEASMIRRDFFELMDLVLSSNLQNDAPFGGVQIVLLGDFFQLPPIVPKSDLETFNDLRHPYCFQSEAWVNANIEKLNLTTNYRQSDPDFINMLNTIRWGKMNNKIDRIMKECLNKPEIPGAVKIFPFKRKVNAENMRCLERLNQPKKELVASYTGKQWDIKSLKKEAPVEEKITICCGARVMLISNHPKGWWFNGSLGTVSKINPDLVIKLDSGRSVVVEKETWEKKKYRFKKYKLTSEPVATITQYPIKLSWSITTHKSQSLTLDKAEIDLSKCFAYGQAYVALSRVKSLNGLKLTGWNPNAIKVDKVVKDFYNNI